MCFTARVTLTCGITCAQMLLRTVGQAAHTAAGVLGGSSSSAGRNYPTRRSNAPTYGCKHMCKYVITFLVLTNHNAVGEANI